MEERLAIELLESFGCRPRSRGKQIESKCPFPDNHRRGDKRPSFSARIDANNWSPFFCHGCGARGTLEQIAISNNMPHLVPGWKPHGENRKPWLDAPRKPRRNDTVFFDDKYLAPFVGMVSGYMLNRGISLETARTWELGIDKENIRATFAVRDYRGRLGVLIGRDIRKVKSKIKYSNYLLDKRDDRFVPWRNYSREGFREDDYVSPTKSHFLYGEHFAVQYGQENPNSDLVLVEGSVDTLKVWQCGHNVVGALGCHVSDEQVSKIMMLTPRQGRLLVMFDGDDAGRRGSNELKKAIRKLLVVRSIELKDGCDPGGMSNDEIDKAIGSMSKIS